MLSASNMSSHNLLHCMNGFVQIKRDWNIEKAALLQPRRIVHRRITTDVNHRPQPIGNKRRATFALTGVKCSDASTASTSKFDDIDTLSGKMSEPSEPSELTIHQSPVSSTDRINLQYSK